MRTKINKKSDFDFIVLDSEGNPIPFPTDDFSLFLWTWGSKSRFKASSIGGVLTGCKNEDNKLRVFVDNPGFVPGKLVGEFVTQIAKEAYEDGSQKICRYISDFGIDMVNEDSEINDVQVLAMMQYIQGASAYEIACEYGYQGTQEEWLASLSLDSRTAANECRELMAEFTADENVREANESARKAAETSREETFATYANTLAAKEDTANKVTSLDNPSDVTFPTSKAVVDGYNNSIAFKVDNIYSQIADSFVEQKYPYFSNGKIAPAGSTNPIGYYTIPQEILSQISHIRAYLECDGNLPAALTFYSSDSRFDSTTRIKAVQMQSATGAYWYESEVPKRAVCCLVVNRKDKYGDPVINALRKDSGIPLDIARIESKIDAPMEYNEELLADLTFAESVKDVSLEINCEMGDVLKVVADSNVPYYWLGTTLYHSEICGRIDGSKPRYVVLNQYVHTLWIRRMIATAEGHIQVYKCSKKELYNYPNLVNSFFKYSTKTISADDWLIGKSHTWTGGYSNNKKRAVTKLLNIRNPKILISCGDTTNYRYTFHYAYRDNGTTGYDSGWITTATYEAEPNCDIIVVMIEKLSGEAITAEDLLVINIEILNETLDDYATNNELALVDARAESIKSDIVSIRNVENIGLVNNRLDVTKPYYYHFQPNGFIKDGSNQSAIASQSSYDIELAARLGFTFIEANVHPTQDGDFVCMHGAGGAFGNTVYSLDGTDITNTKFENVTMSWIKQNVRFNSTYEKYKVAPLSLTEFCQCCKVNGIGIFAGTNSEDAVKVCLQILGTDNVMLYNAPSSIRSIFRGMMFNWNNTTTTTIDSILTTARTYGKPYMYGIGPALLGKLITDSKLGELAQKMHNEGYTLASTAVYDTDDNVQVAFEQGVDFSASGHQVNPFEPNYEVYDLDDEAQFRGTATITGGQALLTTGQTLICGKSDVIGLGKAMLVVRYNGTLTFAFGATSPKKYTSDGTKDIVLSNYFFKRNTTLTITATADTTINHLVYKTSKC